MLWRKSLLPKDYSKEFYELPPEEWKDAVDIAVYCTNVYASLPNENRKDGNAWRSGKSVSRKEIIAFLGMHFLMGVIQLPQLYMYWSQVK
jgi:hypothetical protein